MRFSTRLIALGGFITLGLSTFPAQAITTMEVGDSYDNLVFHGGAVQLPFSASLL
jgi:hypothetical protein